MKMSVFLFFLWGSLFTFAEKANAQISLYDEAGRSFKTRSLSFDFQSTYYNATANYTRGGDVYVTLADGHKFTLLDFDFGMRWVPSPDWAIYATTQVSNAESNDTFDTRRTSSLSKSVIGTDFMVYSGNRFDLYPDFSLTFPFERVDATADEALNREGAIEASAKLIGRLHWKSLDPYAFVGFTYRDEDRASLLPYGIGVEFQLTKWSFGGEVRGYQTVIKDKFTDEPLQRESSATKNGGALRFFSVDPSLLESNIWVRRELSSAWKLKIGGGTSITGSNTSAGWNVIAGLSYIFQSDSPVRPGFWRKRPTDDTRRFQEEINDGVDQKLFKLPPLPPSVPNEAEAQKERKKIQNDLNQTEFQIELKQSKPKKKNK